MKRTLVPLALVFLIAGAALADRFTSARGSFIRIEGTSSLHDWKMEGSAISGELDAVPFAQLVSGPSRTIASEVSATIPVTSIRSEHKKMDKLMAEALKADANPTIQYQLTRAILATPGSTFIINTGGKLTIAGVTRDVSMQVTGTRDAGGRYVFSGEVPIRMSDYGIKPPTAMMGTIRTGNDVKVSFRWGLERAK